MHVSFVIFRLSWNPTAAKENEKLVHRIVKNMLDTDHAAGKAHDCIKAYANFAAKGLYHLF